MAVTRPPALPEIPGAAKTPSQVLDVFRRYPFIFEPSGKDDLKEPAQRKGTSPEGLIRYRIREMLRQDEATFLKPIYDALVNLKMRIPVPSGGGGNFRKIVDEMLFSGLLLDALVRIYSICMGELRVHFFGSHYGIEDSLIRYPKAHASWRRANISPVEWKDLLVSLAALPITVPEFSISVSAFIFYLARATYPERFDFRPLPRPAAAMRSTAGVPPFVDRSIVRPVRKMSLLPPSITDYIKGTALHHDYEIWAHLNREMDTGMPRYPTVMKDLLGAVKTALPIEVILIDHNREQIELVLKTLLANGNFKGDRVRLEIKRSHKGAVRLVAVVDYAVESGEQSRKVRVRQGIGEVSSCPDAVSQP